MAAAAAPLPLTPALTEIPFLLTAEGEALFTRRAARLESLAATHAMREYLRFAALISRAQQQALRHFPATAWPAQVAGQPPLHSDGARLPAGWSAALREICARLIPAAPEAFSASLRQLAALDQLASQTVAQSFLQGETASHDLGQQVVVGAALQVAWMAMLRDHPVAPHGARGAEAPALCPVCGALPVGSSVEAGAGKQGLRYLCCALCATRWNRPRIHCIQCGESKSIAYHHLEGSNGAMQAESCDDCGCYSKLLQVEKSLGGELLADDLASVPLDLLMHEAGYQRYGFNPLLLTANA